MTTLPKQIRVPPYVLVSTVGEESVLLNLRTENYFGLDAVGTSMWMVLTTTTAVDAACQVLQGQFEVEAAVLRRDIAGLLGKLAHQGLIEFVP